jgi:hypothetical protein
VTISSTTIVISTFFRRLIAKKRGPQRFPAQRTPSPAEKQTAGAALG